MHIIEGYHLGAPEMAAYPANVNPGMKAWIQGRYYGGLHTELGCSSVVERHMPRSFKMHILT